MRSEHQRRSPRLRAFDYATARAYFVTICTYERACLLGTIEAGQMTLSAEGELVRQIWQALPEHYGTVILDVFTVMPDHIHAVLCLRSARANSSADKHEDETRVALTEVIRSFKTTSAKRINCLRRSMGNRVWQRSFHDRIIRTEAELEQIRCYVRDNVLRWQKDPR